MEADANQALPFSPSPALRRPRRSSFKPLPTPTAASPRCSRTDSAGIWTVPLPPRHLRVDLACSHGEGKTPAAPGVQQVVEQTLLLASHLSPFTPVHLTLRLPLRPHRQHLSSVYNILFFVARQRLRLVQVDLCGPPEFITRALDLLAAGVCTLCLETRLTTTTEAAPLLRRIAALGPESLLLCVDGPFRPGRHDDPTHDHNEPFETPEPASWSLQLPSCPSVRHLRLGPCQWEESETTSSASVFEPLPLVPETLNLETLGLLPGLALTCHVWRLLARQDHLLQIDVATDYVAFLPMPSTLVHVLEAPHRRVKPNIVVHCMEEEVGIEGTRCHGVALWLPHATRLECHLRNLSTLRFLLAMTSPRLQDLLIDVLPAGDLRRFDMCPAKEGLRALVIKTERSWPLPDRLLNDMLHWIEACGPANVFLKTSTTLAPLQRVMAGLARIPRLQYGVTQMRAENQPVLALQGLGLNLSPEAAPAADLAAALPALWQLVVTLLHGLRCSTPNAADTQLISPSVVVHVAKVAFAQALELGLNIDAHFELKSRSSFPCSTYL